MTDPFLTPRQVYQFLKKQSVPLKPFQGNIYDERVNLDMDLEPLTQPFIKTPSTEGKEIQFSIIIPSYNNKAQLLNTLEKLKEQDYPKDKYEIIPIDDGSNDGTLNRLTDFARGKQGFEYFRHSFFQSDPSQNGRLPISGGNCQKLGS